MNIEEFKKWRREKADLHYRLSAIVHTELEKHEVRTSRVIFYFNNIITDLAICLAWLDQFAIDSFSDDNIDRTELYNEEQNYFSNKEYIEHKNDNFHIILNKLIDLVSVFKDEDRVAFLKTKGMETGWKFDMMYRLEKKRLKNDSTNS